MLITIDGPAGAGKSTVAKLLALALHLEYLDTGAMYRAVAFLGLRCNIPWNEPDQLTEAARKAKIDSRFGLTFLDEDDITEAVRSVEVTQNTKYAAGNPAIREIMVNKQREIAARIIEEGSGLVTEGRDQGTAVFPKADYKIYLTASPEERAKRRLDELKARGENMDFDVLLEQINERDAQDKARTVGPLCQPPDAIVLHSDSMSIHDVVAKLLSLISTRVG